MAFSRINGALSQSQFAEILDCYPTKRQIHGVLRDGGKVMIGVREVSSSFRWPQVGEVWSINQENSGGWTLGHRIHGHRMVLDEDGVYKRTNREDYSITQMEPGELRLDAVKITNALGEPVGTGASGGTPEIYVGPDAPEDATAPYLWYQTGQEPDGEGWTLWLEDGS